MRLGRSGASEGLPCRRKRLHHLWRLFAEYSRPLQNSAALLPLACQASMRAAHSDAFAMNTRMLGRRGISYTGP